ncbi:MAG: hypothetical protein Q4P71_05350 [Actinomycetaceae bacterium]|nr:hypothetical protein [Actinomycetaceae bacterium]
MSDIDDEFDKLIAGFDSDSSVPSASDIADESESLIAGEEVGQEIDLDAPEDEHLHLPGGKHSVCLVLAPLASAEAVSSILGLYGVSRWVVPIAGQVALWFESTEDDSSQFEALLGEERPMPEECDAYARVMSRLSRFGAVAIASSLTEQDDVIQGDVIARRYVNGAPEDSIPAGLLVNWMDSRAEDLLLGRTHPSELPDAIAPQNNPPGPTGRERPMRPGK